MKENKDCVKALSVSKILKRKSKVKKYLMGLEKDYQKARIWTKNKATK